MNKEQSSEGSDQIEMVSTPAFTRPPSTSGHTPWRDVGDPMVFLKNPKKGAIFSKRETASLTTTTRVFVFRIFVSFFGGVYKWSFLLFFRFSSEGMMMVLSLKI